MFRVKEVARLSLLAWSRDPGKTGERLQAIIAVEARREFNRHIEEVLRSSSDEGATVNDIPAMAEALVKTD